MTIQQGTAPTTSPAAASRTGIADCDIHPYPKSLKDEIYPFLESRWQRHIETYGMLPRQGYQSGPAYPKGQPDAARRDAYPPGGGKPGSDLDFMRAQHLDPNGVEFGLLNPLRTGQGLANPGLAAALCRAINEWQVAFWTGRDARLHASIVVPYEDTEAAVAEIHRCAGTPDFAQVLLLGRTAEPLGQRRYRPILAAAAEAGLPVGIHAFGYGGYPVTGGGWPSYYIEEMVGHAQCLQAQLTSLVLEGALAELPTLRLVLIEAGFAWLPALTWRLDRLWTRMRDEVPHLDRPPSDYIRAQIWLTTQPIEEPERPADLATVIDWIGHDRLLFATDYPHWDFDDPSRALPGILAPEITRAILRDNARAVFRRG